MKRADECEYEDKKQKSRTQKLKEKLAMLEDRIKELEGPESMTSGEGSSNPGSPGFFDQIGFDATALGDMDPNQAGPSLSSAWPSTSAGPGSSSSSSSSVGLSLSVPGSPFGSTALNWDNSAGGNSLEMSPFTGMTNSMFPDMPHWDPSTPLPFENKKILSVSF